MVTGWSCSCGSAAGVRGARSQSGTAMAGVDLVRWNGPTATWILPRPSKPPGYRRAGEQSVSANAAERQRRAPALAGVANGSFGSKRVAAVITTSVAPMTIKKTVAVPSASKSRRNGATTSTIPTVKSATA